MQPSLDAGLKCGIHAIVGRIAGDAEEGKVLSLEMRQHENGIIFDREMNCLLQFGAIFLHLIKPAHSHLPAARTPGLTEIAVPLFLLYDPLCLLRVVSR